MKQAPGEAHRRWFQSEDLDLFVWGRARYQVLKFQLTYGKPRDEKSLTWSVEQGFRHDGIDDGQRPGRHPASPLLVHQPEFDNKKLASAFLEQAPALDDPIREFIATKIQNYPNEVSNAHQRPAEDVTLGAISALATVLGLMVLGLGVLTLLSRTYL